MSTLHGHLAERNGMLVVCYARPAFDAPVMIHRYYPTGLHITDSIAEYVGRLVYSGRMDGNRWFIADTSRWVDALPGVAAEIEEQPIDPPRTRLQTRWNGMESRWEKLSRREGWIPA